MKLTYLAGLCLAALGACEGETGFEITNFVAKKAQDSTDTIVYFHAAAVDNVRGTSTNLGPCYGSHSSPGSLELPELSNVASTCQNNFYTFSLNKQADGRFKFQYNAADSGGSIVFPKSAQTTYDAFVPGKKFTYNQITPKGGKFFLDDGFGG